VASTTAYGPQPGQQEDAISPGGSPQQNDRQLLEALAFGEHNAMHRLMLRYQGFLRGRCRMLVHGNRDDANELFSQVIFKVCTERPDRLRDIRHIGGWLSQVARNQHIDSERERQAQERRNDNLGYIYETVGYQAPSPEQDLLNRELAQHIRRAFELLPTRLALAARLRFVEDASYEEIANELAISQANARKRIQEARREMTGYLARYVGDAGTPSRDL
jgi:RNA polymerase sigma-70 factor (ECF subfamily)